MIVHLEEFEENPSEYIQIEGQGYPVFDWLVSRFGLPSAVKIFIDMVRYRVSNAEATLTYPLLHIPGKWVKAANIDSVGIWGKTPQGHAFWALLANELDHEVELTYAQIELIANTIYSDKPLIPGGICESI